MDDFDYPQDPPYEECHFGNYESSTAADIVESIETNLWLADAYALKGSIKLRAECIRGAWADWKRYEHVIGVYANFHPAMREKLYRMAEEVGIDTGQRNCKSPSRRGVMRFLSWMMDRLSVKSYGATQCVWCGWLLNVDEAGQTVCNRCQDERDALAQQKEDPFLNFMRLLTAYVFLAAIVIYTTAKPGFWSELIHGLFKR